ncbi:MAG: polyprenyl synthetase family protein [Bacteroidales bacterium]|nr:polyprenyl synthetase family protein [Bacteroidales bacterium]
MTALDEIKAPIAEELEAFKPFFERQMKSDSRKLNLVVRYALKTKGKQMRPIIVFLCAKMLGKVNDKTFTAAALIELLHTATLVHDDVVDESFYRRGLFSVFALYKAKIAILLGDFFLAKGLLMSLEKDDFDLLKIVSEAVKEMSEGELDQLEHARRMDITEESYYEVIRKKTATLIAACAATGAKSIDATPEMVETMKQFGTKIGLAFQIKDDLFDYQKTDAIGKPKYNDIQERKLTLPVIYALANDKTGQKRAIKKIFRKKSKSKDDIAKIVDFVINNGGVEYSVNKMQELKHQALDLLAPLPDCAAKQSLIKLSDYIINRNK